jgi:hypothetical protein
MILLIVIALETLAVTLRTRTTLSAITTLRTRTAFSTLGTRTTLTLNISLGLRDEYTMREFVLTSLGINLQKLHIDLVAFLQTSLFDSLQTLPVNL